MSRRRRRRRRGRGASQVPVPLGHGEMHRKHGPRERQSERGGVRIRDEERERERETKRDERKSAGGGFSLLNKKQIRRGAAKTRNCRACWRERERRRWEGEKGGAVFMLPTQIYYS